MIAKSTSVASPACTMTKTIEQLVFDAKFLNIAGQAIIMADKDRVIRYWNNGAKKIYSWTTEEAVGRKLEEIHPVIVSKKNMGIINRRLTAGESWSSEVEVKLSGGSGGFLCLIVNFSPIVSSSGQCIGSIIISTDISDEKWMERELATYAENFSISLNKIQQLNDKLCVVGELTRHDLRNKLGGLNAFAYLLKKSYAENEFVMQCVTGIEKVSKQMVDILNFEQIYEQIGIEELKCVNVDAYFNEAANLISDLKGIQLKPKCKGLTLMADSLFRQLLYNLIDNTIKYGDKATQIKLHFKEQTNHLLLIYEDNGAGISEDMRPHLFEKGFGKGTGFGLYTLKRICDTYGWTMSEEGKPGAGVKFVIKVPADRYTVNKA